MTLSASWQFAELQKPCLESQVLTLELAIESQFSIVQHVYIFKGALQFLG